MQNGSRVTCHWHFGNHRQSLFNSLPFTRLYRLSKLTSTLPFFLSLAHSARVSIVVYQTATTRHHDEHQHPTLWLEEAKVRRLYGHETIHKRQPVILTTPIRRLGGNIITILVGPEPTATQFFIHADLVSKHSDFFAACLKPGWKESAESTVRLPGLPATSAAVFEDFLSFLYTGKVYSIVQDEGTRAGGEEEFFRLGDAWVLGEMLLSSSFKDAAVDAIIHKIAADECFPSFECLPLYAQSPAGSPVRRLMVDIAAHYWSEASVSTLDADGDPVVLASFFQSVTVALLKRSLLPKPVRKVKHPLSQESPCFYHEHGEGPCYKSMF